MDRTPQAPAFTAPLKERPSEDVFELAELAHRACELFDHPLWKELMAAGREYGLRMLTQDDTLAHAEYARRAGWFSGLDMGEAVARAVLEKETRVKIELGLLEKANAA